MSTLSFNITLGIGDIIFIYAMTNNVRNKYDQINITFDNGVLATYRGNSAEYKNFLNDIGQLFFSEPPYKLNAGNFPILWPSNLHKSHGIPMVLPKLQHLLCKGTLLTLEEPYTEYIVFTTKVRNMARAHFNQLFDANFWHLMRQLSERYKMVVMGERIVEMNKEYRDSGQHMTYSIYNEIVNNIPKERILDLTLPALGITAPQLKNIQQDCLIMSEAKAVISIGIGGNLQMSVAVANTINYHTGAYADTDLLYGDNLMYEKSLITKHFNPFIEHLKKLL